MAPDDKPVSAPGTALVSAAALVGFLLIFIEAANFGSGARLFPRLLAVVGGISAAVLLAQSCLRVLAERRRTDPRSAGERASTWRDIVISYIGPPFYALMLYLLGFWIASTACLAGLLVLLGERRSWMVAGLTAGTLLAIYLMFEVSFDIRMPRGLLLG
jgi:Tripartite tricarboxylate transporter TctB family